MKAFFVLIKIVTVGIFWSVFFFEGVRVIMYKNWRFDLLNVDHWTFARDLWLSGWVVNTAKEWAFVLILLTSIPLWLTGWAFLCMVRYSKIFNSIFKLPIKLLRSSISNKTKEVSDKIATKTVTKKKSHKEIRPPSVSGGGRQTQQTNLQKSSQPQRASTITPQLPSASKKSSSLFEHSLFDFDEEDDGFDFDLDAPIEKKEKSQEKASPTKESRSPSPKEAPKKQPDKKSPKKVVTERGAPASKGSSNSILEVIKEKGYDFLASVTIKKNMVDFIAFSKTKIILFLVDKEPGDWLADEEKFNGEEPLWFSESSHRISPVRKIDQARDILTQRLEGSPFDISIEAYVINQMNNIINAEDMFDIWQEVDVNVVRIDRGTPKEIPLFAKSLEESEENMPKEDAEKLKKLLRGMS